jgi:hypothetical protein
MSIVESLIALKLSLLLCFGIGGLLYLYLLKYNYQYINYQSLLCVTKHNNIEYCKKERSNKLKKVLPLYQDEVKLLSKKTHSYHRVFLHSKASLNFCDSYQLCRFKDQTSIKQPSYHERL